MSLTLKYQYKLYITKSVEVPLKAEKVEIDKYQVFTFDTYALEGDLFQQILDQLQSLNIAYVLVGEDPGHIEKFGEITVPTITWIEENVYE